MTGPWQCSELWNLGFLASFLVSSSSRGMGARGAVAGRRACVHLEAAPSPGRRLILPVTATLARLALPSADMCPWECYASPSSRMG